MYNLIFYGYILFSIYFYSLYILFKVLKSDRYSVTPISTTLLLIFYLQLACTYWWQSIIVSYYLIFLKLGVINLYFFSKYNSYLSTVSDPTRLSILVFFITTLLLHMGWMLSLVLFEFFSLFFIIRPLFHKKNLQKKKTLKVSFLLINMFFAIFITQLPFILEIKFISIIEGKIFYFFYILFFYIYYFNSVILSLDKHLWSYYYFTINYIENNRFVGVVEFFKTFRLFIGSGLLCGGIIIFNFFDYHSPFTLRFLFVCFNLALLIYFFCFFCLLNEENLDCSWISFIKKYYKYIEFMVCFLIILITGVCNFIIGYDILFKCKLLPALYLKFWDDLWMSTSQYSSLYHCIISVYPSVKDSSFFTAIFRWSETIAHIWLHYFTKFKDACRNDFWLIDYEPFLKEGITITDSEDPRTRLKGACLNSFPENYQNANHLRYRESQILPLRPGYKTFRLDEDVRTTIFHIAFIVLLYGFIIR